MLFVPNVTLLSQCNCTLPTRFVQGHFGIDETLLQLICCVTDMVIANAEVPDAALPRNPYFINYYKRIPNYYCHFFLLQSVIPVAN